MANAVTVKYSQSYTAKKNRIKRLPKLIGSAVSGFTKRDILEIRDIFHDGIKDNTLQLEKLADITLKSKQAKGYEKPNSPLYGAGDDEEERAYANMLNVTKVKNGWKLAPSKRMHHSKKIRLDFLFMIHEHGAIVRQTRGKEEVLIRIPPRPALLLSYRRFLIRKRKNKKEQSKEVKAAMTEYINKASEKKLQELAAWENRT